MDVIGQIEELRAQVACLLDREAVRQVAQRYARALDRHDVELERAVFWPDAQISYGSLTWNRDEFIAWGNETHALYTAQHEHHISTQNIEIDGDVAHAESYVIFLLREADEQSTMVGGARYVDKLEKRDGEWRISLREFMLDILFRANSVFKTEFAETRPSSVAESRRDTSDISYHRPLNARHQW